METLYPERPEVLTLQSLRLLAETTTDGLIETAAAYDDLRRAARCVVEHVEWNEYRIHIHDTTGFLAAIRTLDALTGGGR